MINLICPKNDEEVCLLTKTQPDFLHADKSDIMVDSFDVLDLKVNGTESSHLSFRLRYNIGANRKIQKFYD